MFIKELKVINGITSEIIQDISFVTNDTITGVKLIVDNDDDGKSNNIGKSTVITSIDFCLGAKPNIIFEGVGKSHKDNTIEEFLYLNNITFQLTLEDIENNTYVFQRAFQLIKMKNDKIRKNTPWKLNGEVIPSNKDKKNTVLKNILFGDTNSKPTFRQLLGKFLRDNIFSLADPIKFYHPTTQSSDARAILDRLFYHNTETFSKQKELITQLKKTQLDLKNYEKKHGSKRQLTEFISKQQDEIDRYNEQIEQGRPSNKSNEYVIHQKNLKTFLDEIAFLESEVLSIRQSISRYTMDKSQIDTNAVKMLYNELKIYNEDISKTFEETIDFHNSMLKSRLDYLNNILQDKLKELKQKSDEKDVMLNDFNDKYIVETENIENILLKKIQAEQNFAISSQELFTWDELETSETDIQSMLEEIPESNTSESIDIFNTFFEKYTMQLYDEKMYVSIPEAFTPYEIKNVTNAGTGKGKGIITAFDLAYISYINEINKKAPLFTAIDIFEPTDEPTIEKIFEIANSINGQLIVPVLRSKIAFVENIEQNFVIELSSENKFFKIP